VAKGRGKGKGSQFERDLCTWLSCWWTHNQRDDVFWRSTISGGRATARTRRGKNTYGQYGDVQAVDPVGESLLKVVTIEAKCGYRGAAFSDLLDATGKMRSIWWDWLAQVEEAWAQAKSFSWLLIVKRDRRAVIVVFPYELYLVLRTEGGLQNIRPAMKVRLPIRTKCPVLWAMPLKAFLSSCSPDLFKRFASDWTDGEA